MDDEEFRAQAERLRHHLDRLRERLDPPSYDLLMTILRGVNAALAAGGSTEIDLPPEQREVFSAELQRELLVVMGMLHFAEDHVVIDLGDAPQPGGARPPAPRDPAGERATDRREVEAIARVSGMIP